MNKILSLKFSLLVLVATTTVFAQQTTITLPGVLTAADYARAEKMLSYNTALLVDRAGVRPTWLADGRFWYRVLTPTGSEYVLINPADGKRTTAAEQAKLGVEIPSAENNQSRNPNEILSPDGKRAAFIREYNLWMRDIATKKETQLTTDGAKDFGYATDNAGWRKSDRPILLWSPDSRKIATYQQDQRHVSDMYLVTTNVGAPKLQAWKYPLPEDKDIIRIHRVIIEIDNPKAIRLKMPPDARRGTLCDDISCSGSFDDNEWNSDATKLVFVSSSRDHKEAKLRIADAATGEIRDVHEEKTATQFESGQGTIN